MPRNPQRNPRPSEPEDSSSKEKDESESFNLPSESLSRAKSSASSGKTLAQTTGIGCIYPGSGAEGLPALVTVSPTEAMPGFLMPVTIYPISPEERKSRGVSSGE